MVRVYVSSTRDDLHAYRQAVSEMLRRRGYEDVAMEHYVAEGRTPIEKCLEDVASCDLYVGLIAWRYGSDALGYDRSFTELELDKAIEAGIETLVFVLSDEAPWPRALMDRDLTRIEALRQKVSDLRLRSTFFSDPNDLRATLGDALQQWEQRQGIRIHVERTDWDRYRQAVLAAHEYVRLSVIAGAKQDRVAPVPLTEVFVPPLVETGKPSFDLPDEVLKARRETLGLEPLSPREADRQPASEGFDDEQAASVVGRTEGILDVVCRERLQVFLGGPGSGKTTLLHYALLRLCAPRAGEDRILQRLAETAIPFLIELRQYALDRAPDFLSYLERNAQSKYGVDIERDELRALLDTPSRAVVFFDGLDEIFGAEERARVIEQFVAFARRFPNTSIVVTSRIVGYDDRDIGLAGFEHYTLLNFSLAEIGEFVPRWYRYYTWQGDERDAEGLLQRISDSPRLLDLAGNPLLLTMMSVIYKHQDLPEQRWQLYERCTSVLLEDWDFKRKRIDSNVLLPVNLPIHQAQKAEILQQVSMYMLRQGLAGKELNAIAHKPLMKILADYLEHKYGRSRGEAEAIADDVLRHLRERSSILAEIGESIFGFVHRTFMEYFAATSCLAEFNAREADYAWLTQEIFGLRWKDDHWREVLLLLIAMLATQRSPIRKVVEYLWKECRHRPAHNVVFAAFCLAEAGKVEDIERARALMNALVRQITREVTRTKRPDWLSMHESDRLVNEGLSAFAALCQLVPASPTARGMIETLNGSTTRRARIVGWQMAFSLLPPEERLDFALTALRDREEAVRRGAVAALGREWPRHPRVGDALVNVVRTERNIRVRQDALETLRRSWPGRSDLLDVVRARASEERAYTFVSWLMDYVVAGWAPNTEALELVLLLAATKAKAPSNYEYEHVVGRAVVHLLHWAGQVEAESILRQQLAGSDPILRQVALLALGPGWPKPGTFRLLDSVLAEDPDLAVRVAAACGMGWGASRDPDGRSRLLALAADQSADLSVRQVALLAMGDASREAAGVQDLLRTLATSDPSLDIRLTGLWALTRCTSPPKLILEGFYGRSFLPGLRIGADSRRSNTPENVAMLRDRATEDEHPKMRAAALLGLRLIGGKENLALIRQRARHDHDPVVRVAALGVLNSHAVVLDGKIVWLTGPFDPDAKSRATVEQACRDPDPMVRAKAVQIVTSGFGWSDDLRRSIAAEEPEFHLRAAALRCLGGLSPEEIFPGVQEEIFPAINEVKLREILNSRLYGDQDSGPDLVGFLRRRAIEDESPYVRQTALVAALARARTNPATRQLLEEQLTAKPDVSVGEIREDLLLILQAGP